MKIRWPWAKKEVVEGVKSPSTGFTSDFKPIQHFRPEDVPTNRLQEWIIGPESATEAMGEPKAYVEATWPIEPCPLPTDFYTQLAALEDE